MTWTDFKTGITHEMTENDEHGVWFTSLCCGCDVRWHWAEARGTLVTCVVCIAILMRRTS
jgi:hypothetical protein